MSATNHTIRVVPQNMEAPDRWTPVMGPIFTELLARLKKLTDTEREELTSSSVSILGRCLPPAPKKNQPFAGTTTGLAVGYVQSGKTLSFTCVSALAADNGFPLVIIITGTTEPLYRQTVDRLRDDLIDLAAGVPWRWQAFENPGLRNQNSLNSIQETMAKWRDHRQLPEDCPTALLLVMKNHRRLQNLSELLSQVDLSQTPALIIDDEADQASLNNLVNRQDQSRTYERILELKFRLPRHTFLQYTATPQAPLLINIIDVLSPKFASVLEPGAEYIDLHSFFGPDSQHVEIIPALDIPSDENPLDSIPASLEAALRLFFVGVAQDIERKANKVRSMLVHPSKFTAQHANYADWINAVIRHWKSILGEDPSHPDRQDLLSQFKRAYDDLTRTQVGLDSFGVLAQCLYRALSQVTPWLVNARGGKTQQPDWKRTRAHILVGGTAVDRGFTVEGLTVTYMPRGTGVGNADTIQQRARFLGYKASYFGLCRVFVEQNVFDAYSAYVKHETDIRTRLATFDRENKPLHEWKRAFFLDQSLRPTRQSVLDLEYQQGTYSAQWFFPKGPHVLKEATASNLTTVNDFILTLGFRSDHGDLRRTTQTKHGVAESVPINRVYEELLVRFKAPHPRDSQEFTGVLLQVEAYLEAHPTATATVYLMSWEPNQPQHRRERSVRESTGGDITTARAFFQGANPSQGAAIGSIYPGDDAIRDDDNLTIQIHRLRVLDSERKVVLAEDTYALAIWVPACMERDTLVQDSKR